MPTIYHRPRFKMVSTLRFAHPTVCEPICSALGWVERSDTHHLTHDRDGFRFALPILRPCELICFARKRNLDARLRPIGTTGKSLKPVQSFAQKYSAFVLTQIIGITPPVSRQMRGVGHRHERAVRCDGRKSCD